MQSTTLEIAYTESTMGRASIIEAYIQQLLAWDQPITPSALKAIAQQFGITEGELAAIDLKVENHLTRSHNYLDIGNLNSAIDELVQASTLDPINVEVLSTLADLYYQRYQRESHLSDRQQTLLVAKRCVELYPNNKKALALLKRLKRTAGYQVVSRQQRPKIFAVIELLQQITDPGYVLWWTKNKLSGVHDLTAEAASRVPSPPPPSPATTSKLTFFAMYMAAASLVFVGVSRVSGFSQPSPNAIISNASFFNDKGAANPEAVDDIASVPVFDPGPNIPVTFHHPGLFIEPRLSRLGEYDGADYYKLHGLVINDSGQEVRKLNLKLELLDGNGVAIATINQSTIGNSSIRPGDTQPFELFHKITPDLIRVRVSVTDIEQVVDNKPYDPPISDNYSLGSRLPSSGELISRSEAPSEAD